MFSDEDDDLLFMGESFDTTSTQNTVSKRPATVSKVKPSKKHKGSGWVTSAFDEFFTAPSNNNSSSTQQPSDGATSRKRQRETGSLKEKKAAWKRLQVEDELWYEKHSPKNQVELAVHKKKICEVETWLRTNTDYREGHKAPILLLTGPAGCGKTACIRCLAQELRTEVQEWINPVSSTERDIHDQDAVKAEYSSVGGYQTKSQLALFEEFLLRANKYPTLQIFGGQSMSRKLVLVEDFPNVFLRDASVFHNILRRYRQNGRCPLVFIITDSAGGESNERLLFPKDIQAELCVENISFNPVAPTMMTKILDRIAGSESRNGSRSYKAPSKSVIEGLATACSGDIRGAINALQFACLIDTTDLTDLCKITSKTSSKVSKTSRNHGDNSRNYGTKQRAPSGIGGKDSSIFLFRALGKILYCKREGETSSPVRLPAHLLHHHRPPLSFQPEDVVERSCMSSDFFNDYLHQNYLDFYPVLSDVVRASEYLSTSDSITSNWATRGVMCEYASSIATRGLLHCNTSRLPTAGSKAPVTGGYGWRPLHKPQWYETRKKMRTNIASAEDLFRTYGVPPRDLQIEVLPYLALINTPLHNPAQITFLQTITKFNKYYRPSCDRLEENDVTLHSEDSRSMDSARFQTHQSNSDSNSKGGIPEVTEVSSSQTKVKDESQEDEFEIEEFDD